jgi:signal transduction histidine kinase
MNEEPPASVLLEKARAELAGLNRELEETNRGVLALYAELDDRAKEIQQAVELKSRFLTNITHEFRTPLHSIIGLSRMLLERVDGELTPEQEKQARFIHSAARDLAELVNDLLDLAKTEAGKAEVQLAPVSLNELFSTLRGMLRPLAEANPAVTLHIDVPADPLMFTTDERKLAQILRNLVSNALKYTAAGSVRASVQLSPDGAVFTVTDTGIGIGPEHHGKIFEAFYQVQNPLQQKNKGSGIGLALTHRLVKLLGGDIAVQSAVGAGSTFVVALPHPSPFENPPSRP